MMYTTVPATVICLVLYCVLGVRNASANADLSNVQLMLETLGSNFNISILALIPAILVLVTSALRMPAVPAMLGCTAISGVFACLLQKASLTTCYFGGMTLENGRLVHRQDDCSGCGLCAHSCGRGAVTIRELE